MTNEEMEMLQREADKLEQHFTDTGDVDRAKQLHHNNYFSARLLYDQTFPSCLFFNASMTRYKRFN